MLHSVDVAGTIPPEEPPPKPVLRSPIRPPSLCLFLSEPSRSAAESMTLMPCLPWLARARRGHGEPVLVLPGLLGTDTSTLALRRYLSYLGYAVHGWGLGRNHGPTLSVMEGVPSAVWQLFRRYQQPVALVGWSLGGVYARHVARITPDLISQVVTLGSPFAMSDRSQTRVQKAYYWHSARHVIGDELFALPESDARPLPVPSTSIYSRTDGIVAWQTCREEPGPYSENVAVRSSHLGFCQSPSALWVVADRLAQGLGHWRPFRRPCLMRLAYPADSAGRRTAKLC